MKLLKFCYIPKNVAIIALMAFLAVLSDATDFDPEKKRAAKTTRILWDYSRFNKNSGGIEPLKKEDIDFLSEVVWQDHGLPKRFISEAEWSSYEKLAKKKGYELIPQFILAGGKRLKTAGNHYLKIKDLIDSNLKNGISLAFDQNGNPIRSISELNGDCLVSSELLDKYLESSKTLFGEPPPLHSIRGYKMLSQANQILAQIAYLKLDPLNLPRRLPADPSSTKLAIQQLALQNYELFPSKATFNQAWYRLTKSGEIRYTDSA
ncbi:hypothetical protein FD961_07785 [Polynucleobacter sp. TSB-Sco08W16]|uniref:hypothetical protein n=1 Tax=Polynucleobacter sp. TSB-Sco08W16 TaxID=1758374 RepID=UPI001BFE3956|nr:hypothetical protein [Polynucleobacter sp. TSB-Sco08W16]QWD73966.1 hypothetical protein FD961_07785 [Polynucleobacter sp. TSB-Sco08W16]